jgi:Zn finger protein HypA/HybF involved in hydrogenase expression
MYDLEFIQQVVELAVSVARKHGANRVHALNLKHLCREKVLSACQH